MCRIVFIIYLLLQMSLVLYGFMLSNTVDPVLKSFYEKFVEEIRTVKEGNLIDDIDNSDEDLLRYNFGLTNEDKYLNASQLITKYGYPVEEYEVETPDGYLLTLIRIPGSGQPVLLMHGLICSADEYLTSAPGNALAYILADAGFDVWLSNARGNKYSMKHVSLSIKDEKFWDFSFHEIGVYDLPSNIDFILQKLSVPSLYYIGHSQGTTASYVMLSEKPEYNNKIILLVSLSPVAWMNNLVSPVIRAIIPLRNEVYTLLNSLGLYDFLPDDTIINTVKEAVCGTSVTASLVCSTIVSPLFGFDYIQLNFTNYPVQLAHVPAGSSVKQLIHYGQEVPKSEQFQQFDYGAVKNKKRYGSTRPPPYPVTKITAKTVLFYSTNDWLSSPTDVDKLASKLSNLVLYYKVPFPFNHLDYCWAKDVKELVYLKILELFDKYQS